jgi:gluconolactonase
MNFKTMQISLTSLVLLPGVWLHAGAQDVTPAIPGVVKAGTQVVLVKDGFEAVEGPLPRTDGSVLFTNNQTSRIMQVAPDGSVSTWYEGKGKPNALTYDAKGLVVATLQETLAIGVVQPGAEPRVLVGSFEGKQFNRPNDLVADKRGNIYFTDSVPLTATTPPVIPSALYQLTTDGMLVRITSDIPRPNGVALSVNEQTLYVANTSGEWVYAYTLDRKGTARKRREFARLATPPSQNGAAPAGGADGLAIDKMGRLYVATTLGVQVFSAKGKPLGIIAMPKQPQNLAFSGPSRSMLYVVGRGAVYRIATLTQGPDRAGK